MKRYEKISTRKKSITVKLGPKSTKKLCEIITNPKYLQILHTFEKPNNIVDTLKQSEITTASYYRIVTNLRKAGLLILLKDREDAENGRDTFQSVLNEIHMVIVNGKMKVTASMQYDLPQKNDLTRILKK